jgi:predicted MPP superfamily phosphohydrolase
MKIGVFTDLHYDFVPDAERRLKIIIDDFTEQKVDFAVSLGDLCSPKKENDKIIDQLKSLPFPCFFCIGNHSKVNHAVECVTKFLKMHIDYYSITYGKTKFIFLDSSFENQDRPYIPEDEKNWLKEALADDCYKVIFSHHSLINDSKSRGISNRKEIRNILEEENKKFKKILLCMNGHDHGSQVKELNGIYYYTLNSCSYIWHGKKEIFAYPQQIHENYPYLANMILYREPLHSIVTIDENMNICITGMKGHYDTITPQNVGIGDEWNGVSIKPETISVNIPYGSEFC